jgi:WD40 repeat protein
LRRAAFAFAVAVPLALAACGPSISKPAERLYTERGLAVDVVVVSPDGRSLALATNPHNVLHGAPVPPSQIEIWDVAARRRLRLLPARERTEALSFSPDGRRLYAGAYDKTITILDVQDGKELSRLLDTDAVCCLAVTPDGKTLLSGGAEESEKKDHHIRVWDLTTNKIVRRLSAEPMRVLSLALSPGGTGVVAGKGDVTVEVFDLPNGVLVHTLKCQAHYFNRVKTVAISPDGKLLATGSGSKLEVWELKTARSLRVFTPHRSSLGESEVVNTLAFSPDGRFLASSGRDGTTKLWDTKTWRPVRAFAERPLLKMSLDVYTKTDAESLAFGPAGDLLFSGHDDGIVRVWEVPPATR